MKIEREFIAEESLQDFADANGLTMVIMERPLLSGNPSRYYARFRHTALLGDGVLIGVYGNGATEEEAMRNYVTEISLKRILVSAHDGKYEKEIWVPRLFYKHAGDHRESASGQKDRYRNTGGPA